MDGAEDPYRLAEGGEVSLGGEDFECWWPEVSARLARALARRGVSQHDAEDILQETALRALAAAPPVASVTELLRWSFTVAKRIEIDRARRRGRAEIVPIDAARLPAAPADVARIAEHRIGWATAVVGLSGLSTADRTALLGVLADEEPVVDRRQAVREAVRRHRARLRLVAAVGKLVGVGVAAAHALRRLAARLRPTHAEIGFVMAVGVLLLPSTTNPPPAAAAAPPPTELRPAMSSTTQASSSRPAAAAPRAHAPARPTTSPITAPTPAGPSGGGGDRPPKTIPVGPDHALLPVLTSGSSYVDPNRPVVCAFNDPDVDCVKGTARLRSTNL